VAVLLLVAVPLTLLGAVTPYAVRLALGAIADDGHDAVAKAGSIAGRLSALATGGSLVGTFLAALLLIPLVGTRRTFLVFALLIAIVALWGLLSVRRDEEPGDDALPAPGRALALSALVPLAIALLIILPTPTIKAAAGTDRLLEERETSEQYARVLQGPDGTRTMELGEGQAVHSLYRPGTVLTQNYWDELLVLPQLTGHAPRRVLILGNAGGTTATALRALDDRVQVDAVDYDGQLSELGKRWFGLGGPRLKLIAGDARVELRRSAGDYDAIMVDAYRQPYIPFHLSTQEFFELARERLAPGGVVIVNVGHPEGDDKLERVLAATMRAAGLTSVLRDPAQAVNTQLVGSAEPLDPRVLAASAAALEAQTKTTATAGTPAAGERTADRLELASTTRATAARLEPAQRGGSVYTDDKAPVEWLIDGSLAKVALGR
jgi:predicted membrane-bound spermidine synthase